MISMKSGIAIWIHGLMTSRRKSWKEEGKGRLRNPFIG
jgi:hypothetical protein